MVTNSQKRKDTSIRISKWLDGALEDFLSDKKTRIEFPSKRNFVDNAVLLLLKKKKVKLK